MERAASVLGTVMGATAILYMLWIYSIATFVAVPGTVIHPGWEIDRLTYVVLGAAMLQLLAAGMAVEVPWASVVAGLLAVLGYLYAVVTGPEVLAAWLASAILMVGCVLVTLAAEIGMVRGLPRRTRTVRGFHRRSRDTAAPPSWELKDGEE